MKHPFFSDTPSRTQRLGILLLFVLIVGISLWQFYLKRKPDPIPQIANRPNWDSLLQEVDPQTILPDSVSLQPFPFDPNTVSDSALRQMGLRNKVVRMWTNYRNKGGFFYNKEQVQRLYSLTDTEFKQLLPFIQLPEKNSLQKKEIRIIELNRADTASLNTLPGIGHKRAEAIVNYRKALGGFYHKTQLLEISLIDTQTYQKIAPYVRVNAKYIQTLPLLDITWNEFNKHPYFKGETGRAILRFRKEKNYRIDNLDELKEINEVDDKIFRKIVPYLRLN